MATKIEIEPEDIIEAEAVKRKLKTIKSKNIKMIKRHRYIIISKQKLEDAETPYLIARTIKKQFHSNSKKFEEENE